MIEIKEAEKQHRTVVRVVDSYYETSRGVAFKRELNVLRRQCYGFNIIDEDSSNCGVVDFMQDIENLLDVEEGIYELVYSNISYDWETGYPDAWGYKLIPMESEDE